MTIEVLYEHVSPYHLIARGELALRQDQSRSEGVVGPADLARDTRWLRQWVSTLELTLVITSLQEACTQLAVPTPAAVLAQRDRVDGMVRLLSRLDVDRVLAENATLLAAIASTQAPADAPIIVEPQVLVRAVQSLLLNCPMADIERAGARTGGLAISHRCSLAFDALQAFVARTTHPAGDSIRAAGVAYAEGRLEIAEVATLWGVTAPDAIAILEEQGYRRDVDGVRLAPDARRARLAAIRRDREMRAGAPTFDQGSVDRDVIASQRIEGVDARPWLRP